jgi:hypothetical protein
MRSRHIAALVLFTLVLSGCGPTYRASDHSDATTDTLLKGFLNPDPNALAGSKTLGQLGGIAVTHLTAAKGACDGSAGSILPPLSLVDCTVRAAFLPATVLENVIGQAPGRTVVLRGLEKYWISQHHTELCWAAALETARGYLHLKHVPFDQMPSIMSNECPNQRKGGGPAQTFQIAYTSSSLSYHLDRVDETIQFCSDEPCIVRALERGRPIIALKASHAVLIQGVEIEQGTSDLIQKYLILDPDGNGKY